MLQGERVEVSSKSSGPSSRRTWLSCRYDRPSARRSSSGGALRPALPRRGSRRDTVLPPRRARRTPGPRLSRRWLPTVPISMRILLHLSYEFACETRGKLLTSLDWKSIARITEALLSMLLLRQIRWLTFHFRFLYLVREYGD